MRWRVGILMLFNTQFHHQPHMRSNTIRAQNKNGVQQGGSTVGVVLRCIHFFNDFFGERHCAGQKEADFCGEMTVNT